MPEPRVNRKRVIGTVEQYPTKTAAKRAIESLRLTINAASAAVPVTIEQLVKHYEQNELPSKAYSTQRTWQGCLKTHVLPSWGGHRLSEVKTVEVELWLRNLPLANATKAKIRNVMHVIFTHACRHEWIIRNPISLVRQSAKRKKTPDVLEAVELKKLIAELQDPASTLVFLTVTTGLRISEAMGLRWSDIDFSTGEIHPTHPQPELPLLPLVLWCQKAQHFQYLEPMWAVYKGSVFDRVSSSS
jgi:integrase